MGRGIIRDDVTDNAGNAIQGKEVTIYIADTVTKATLYDASTGGSEIGNPVVTDEDGVFEAYADTGEYEVEIDGQIEGRYNAVDGDELADLLAIKNIGGLTTADKVTYDGESANVKLALDARVPTVATLGELQGVSTTGLVDGVSKRDMDGRTSAGDGAEGRFVWRGGNQSANVANDEVTATEGDGGIWVAPASDKTGASGAWERIFKVSEKGISLLWYGAKDDSVVADAAGTITAGTDNAAAIQAWVKATLNSNLPAFAPKKNTGVYYTSSKPTIDLPTHTDLLSPSGRTAGAVMFGSGADKTVFYAPTVSGALFDFSVNAAGDFSLFQGFSIKTLKTGCGGIKFGEAGTVVFRDFFMDGCGSGEWGLDLDKGGNGPFQVLLDSCRFWNDSEEYFGGAIRHLDGHTLMIQNTFISKQKKDGIICEIGAVNNVCVPSITLESNPDGAQFTNQIMWDFTGNCITAWFGVVHGENVANTLFKVANNVRHIHWDTIYGWTKDTGGFGDPDAVLIDASAVATYTHTVEHLFFKSDVTASPTGTGYLVDDPNDKIQVGQFSESASGGQSGRPVKQKRYTEDITAQFQTLGTTTAPNYTFELGRAGTYLVSTSVMSNDNNHARTATYLVTFDDSANDFISVQLLGSEVTKGSGTAAFTTTVDNVGNVNVSSTGWTSRNYSARWGWRKLSQLPWS